jgi:hypothetical protein
MEREKSFIEKIIDPLREGVIYMEVSDSAGRSNFREDVNFASDIKELASQVGYTDSDYFFLERDIQRGVIPRARVFAFEGVLYRLSGFFIDNKSTAVAKEVYGERKIDLAEGRVVSVTRLR